MGRCPWENVQILPRYKMYRYKISKYYLAYIFYLSTTDVIGQGKFYVSEAEKRKKNKRKAGDVIHENGPFDI